MTLAKSLADLNAFHFLREFTFSKTTFRPAPTSEVELADNIVWLDNIFIVFQLKQREPIPTSDSNSEERWFEKKILGRAVKQVRDTLKYLKENVEIKISNHRNHQISLPTSALPRPHKLIVYQAHESLPDKCKSMKYHRSGTAGVIHLFPLADYTGIVETLITPSEIIEYLEFREALVERWEEKVNAVSEQALVGQYLNDDMVSLPSQSFVRNLQQLDDEPATWDISRILQNFLERRTFGDGETEYYSIVSELAKLNRGELKAFKERILISMEKAKANEDDLPYRMTVPRTGCGFVFVPVTKNRPLAERLVGLKNFTILHKYDQKLEKCIGVTISLVADSSKQFDFEWCFTKWDWEKEDAIDDALKTKNPFRKVRGQKVDRYRLKF